MATIQKTQTKGSAFSCKGTMPPDKLKQFKLTENLKKYDRIVCRNDKLVRDFVRKYSTYRMFAHKVATTYLPASIKYTAHYFSVPLTRSDSDNPKDRKGLDVAAVVDVAGAA